MSAGSLDSDGMGNAVSQNFGATGASNSTFETFDAKASGQGGQLSSLGMSISNL